MSCLFDEVKRAVSIEEAIRHYLPMVELRRAGKNLVTLCPFHQERTPSFTVSREKNIFYCFGCGAGGDTIKLVSLALGVRPGEAAKIIAHDFGLPLPGKPLAPGARKKAQELARRREAERTLKILIDETHSSLCSWYRVINKVLSFGWPAYLEFSEWVHALPVIENRLDILEKGTVEEKLRVVEEFCS
ncbi:MAG: hypothetical protein K6U74_09130 [Firmicutes bacterium]|nr:hypothetical protein [Bacillota bacterium]